MDIKKKDTTHIRSDTAISDLEEVYVVGKVLGQGSFGVVNLVEHKITRESYACKIVKKRIGATSAYEQQEREVNILKNLNHPNILLLYEVYETSKSIAMIMEFCEGGEMGRMMRDEPDFCNETTIRSIITQLIDTVTYLHRNRIIHRDIKPENILLKSKGKENIQIKIADFGLACYEDGAYGISNIAGTPLYMAPEIVQKLGYNHSCDIWSIGIILYMFLCGYNKKAETHLHAMVIAGKIEYPDDLWQNVDMRASAKKLCELILRFDPAKRISAGEIQSHPWILNIDSSHTNTANNVLDLMKSYNAERRFKRAITFVTAAVRFANGAKKMNNIAEELSITIDYLDTNDAHIDSAETVAESNPLSRISSKSSVFVKERQPSRGAIVSENNRKSFDRSQIDAKRSSIPESSRKLSLKPSEKPTPSRSNSFTKRRLLSTEKLEAASGKFSAGLLKK